MDETKILELAYGDFKCKLEGFDNPFPIMRKVVNFFENHKDEPDYARGDASEALDDLVDVICRASGTKNIDAMHRAGTLGLRNTDVAPPFAETEAASWENAPDADESAEAPEEEPAEDAVAAAEEPVEPPVEAVEEVAEEAEAPEGPQEAEAAEAAPEPDETEPDEAEQDETEPSVSDIFAAAEAETEAQEEEDDEEQEGEETALDSVFGAAVEEDAREEDIAEEAAEAAISEAAWPEEATEGAGEESAENTEDETPEPEPARVDVAAMADGDIEEPEAPAEILSIATQPDDAEPSDTIETESTEDESTEDIAAEATASDEAEPEEETTPAEDAPILPQTAAVNGLGALRADEFILTQDLAPKPEPEAETAEEHAPAEAAEAAEPEPLVLGGPLPSEEEAPLVLDAARKAPPPPNADPDLLAQPEPQAEPEPLRLTPTPEAEQPSEEARPAAQGGLMSQMSSTLGRLTGAKPKEEETPPEPAEKPEAARPRTGLAGLRIPKLGRKPEDAQEEPAETAQKPLSVVSEAPPAEAAPRGLEETVAERQSENALRRLRIIRNADEPDPAPAAAPAAEAPEPAPAPKPTPEPAPAAKPAAALAKASGDNEIASKLNASFNDGQQTATALAIEIGEDDGDDEDMSPRRYARLMGAATLPDLMESAAAYIMLIEGEAAFTRSEIMSVIDRIGEDAAFTAEARIKSFGKLMRGGRLTRIADGRFVLAEKAMKGFIEKMDAYDEANPEE
ncbi:MAG: hypothetical protein AAFY59_01270 [Pseudomonadota bacterium]